MHCLTKSSDQNLIKDKSHYPNFHSPWFENKKLYTKDLVIHRIALAIIIGISALLIYQLGALAIQPFEKRLYLRIFIVVPLACLAGAGTFFAFQCCSKLGFMPNLNQTSKMQRICYKIENLTLKTLTEWLDSRSKENLFESFVRYEIWDKNTLDDVKKIVKDYKQFHKYLFNITEHSHERHQALQTRWAILKGKMIAKLPYLSNSL